MSQGLLHGSPGCKLSVLVGFGLHVMTRIAADDVFGWVFACTWASRHAFGVLMWCFWMHIGGRTTCVRCVRCMRALLPVVEIGSVCV